MASPQGSQKWGASNLIKQYDFDPGATSVTEISWQDMRDFGTFACTFTRTIGTGNTTFAIIANTASDGSGTDATIKTHAIGSQPDAVIDMLFLECTAEELAQEGSDAGVALRYVTATVSVATGTDEGVVTYVLGSPRWSYLNLSTDIVA